MKISCLELSTVIWLQDMRRSHADPQSSSKQQEQQHQQQRTQQEQHVQQQVPATIAVHQEWDLGVAVVGSASFTAAATSLVGALHVFGRLVVVGVVVVVTLFLFFLVVLLLVVVVVVVLWWFRFVSLAGRYTTPRLSYDSTYTSVCTG